MISGPSALPAKKLVPITQTAAGYCSVFFILGFIPASLGPALPILMQHTGSQLGDMGWLFSARSLGYLVGSFQRGRLYDRVPGHRLMAVLLLVLAGVTVIVPTLPALSILAAAYLLLGAIGGALDLGGNSLLVWVHRHVVTRAMNGMHFCFGLGSLAAPAVIAQTAWTNARMQAGYGFMAALALPVVVWLLCVPSPAGKVPAQNLPTSAGNWKTAGLFALFLFLYGGVETGFGGWIFTYTVRVNLAGEVMAAYLTSAFWTAFTLGRLVAIPVATRRRLPTIMAASLLGAVLSLSTILIWPSSSVALLGGTLGAGLSLASITPSMLSLAQAHLPIKGRAIRWLFAAFGLGGMSIPWLLGRVLESQGPQAGMAAIFLAAAGMGAVYLVLSRASLGPRAPGSITCGPHPAG